MNTLNVSNPIMDALGWTLLHAIWQGFALVLPAAIVLHFLRNRSSAVRYRVGVIGLLAQVLVSVGTFGWLYKPAVALSALTTAPGSAAPTLSVRWQMVTQALPWYVQLQQFLAAHLGEFVLIYLIGVAVFALRLAGGWLYLQRISQTATRPASERLVTLVTSLRELMQVRAVVRVRESARVAVPMVVGILTPILLLPVGLITNLSMAEVEAILAHELAHVKRHDYAVNLLQSVVEVLYFFHPALWWLSARVREEREHCCDDLAVQTIGGNGRVLAQALAHIEELRQTQLTTPVLAMALTSKRQQLLHRVRRMLGVPTRPFVSNGSLAGLTLATLLLLSASVYAVQQKTAMPNQPKPKSTQRFNGVTSGKRIGYTLLDGRLTAIDVNGKRLLKTRVDQIQRQLDQVMAGQLNLDDVQQPDRDILLTIIEKNNSFDTGMSALTDGLSNIKYDIVASVNNVISPALNGDTPFDSSRYYMDALMDSVNSMKGVQWQAISVTQRDTSITGVVSVVTTTRTNTAQQDQQREYHQRQMDSLSQLIAQRSQQMQAMHLEMEKLRFPVDELNRQNDVLNWRKDKLMEQRDALTNKHQQLLQNNGKQKLSQAETEKQLAALEPDIKKLEESMIDLNRQMEASNAKQEELKRPMEKMEQQTEQLQQQVEKLSEQIERHGDAVVRLMPVDPMVETEYILRPARPPRAPRPPKPLRGMVRPTPPTAPTYRVIDGVIVRPAAPTPAAKPVPTPRPAAAPRSAPTPRPAPKPAPAPPK